MNPEVFKYFILGVIIVSAVTSIILLVTLILKTIQRTTGMLTGKSRKTKEKPAKQTAKKMHEAAAPVAPSQNQDSGVEYEITYIQSQERIDPEDL